ncbi:hypothetical protein FJT64_008819 [Amphibalanus amphitrite]|uniref:RRM domain-containing protein n=1 Tax=Amphibalanus amphitrite TaxID=1232801 RepID=A0A6A4VV61_AMPAM|nr:uncharacterized protein LOC122384144 [Amphibalanus amphitrite]KAF0293291.1 hypothetical protein FJT64_008819 [Amphibalanus amphitrite]
MRLSHVAVLVCALGWVAAQDAYTQGVVNGATLALAGTAVVGLGAIAIKQHQNRNRYRNRYRYNAYPSYNYYNYDPYYQQQQYYYRRRRSTEPEDDLERDFEKIMAQDKGQCGMRVVCELEAQAASGAELSDFGRLIVSLFGPTPGPVPAAALDTAHGRYGYAAYVGFKSGLASCAELYSSCQFGSKTIMRLVQASQTQPAAAENL